MSAPRVVLAVADQLTRTGLRVALAEAGFEVAGEVDDGNAAAARAASAQADLVLVSSDLAGGAARAARRVAAARPSARIVVLAEAPSGDELVECVLAGASGYLAAEGGQERLAPTLRGILAGEVALPRRHTERLLDELRGRRARRIALDERSSRPLTDREWEVLELLEGGASSADIARRLRIAEVTVRRHASSAAAKLGVSDRRAATGLLRERSGP